MSRAAFIAVAALLTWSAAWAGSVDTRAAERQQLQLCTDVALPLEAERSWGLAAEAWAACASDLERLGHDAPLRTVRDHAALLRALDEAEPLYATDPHRWAVAVLRVAADQDTLVYPTPVMTSVFQAWTRTEPGKARLEPVRAVNVRWEARTDERVSQVFRRHVEDLGLRWAEAGAPETGVILYARIRQRDLEPRTTTRIGSLARAEAAFVASQVRMPRVDRTDDGFETAATAEQALPADAREEALQEACRHGAARLLKQVLRTVLQDEEFEP
jgi:hypothetical protein